MVAIIEKEEKQKESWVEKNRRKYNGTRLQQWLSVYLSEIGGCAGARLRARNAARERNPTEQGWETA